MSLTLTSAEFGALKRRLSSVRPPRGAVPAIFSAGRVMLTRKYSVSSSVSYHCDQMHL